MPKNPKPSITKEQVEEAKAVLEQATSTRGCEFFNVVQDDGTDEEIVSAFNMFKKECRKEYEKIIARKPVPEPEVIITISLTKKGATYIVGAHNCKVPEGFPLKGDRELKKAKGIVSRCVYDFGFAERPAKEEA